MNFIPISSIIISVILMIVSVFVVIYFSKERYKEKVKDDTERYKKLFYSILQENYNTKDRLYELLEIVEDYTKTLPDYVDNRKLLELMENIKTYLNIKK